MQHSCLSIFNSVPYRKVRNRKCKQSSRRVGPCFQAMPWYKDVSALLGEIQKKKKANQRRRLWVSSFFKLTFIYEHWLVNTASWEDPEAIVFVSNTFMSSCAICLIIAREIGNWELHTGSSIKMAANRQETVSSLLNQAIRRWSNDTKQERFQARKKCNRCQFCFGLVLIYQPGHA